MREKKIKNFCSYIIAIFMLFSVTNVSAFANTEESIPSEICIVYDNSASTFRNDAWCIYKYAMEIFASMVDYQNGSRINIYPLNEVTLDGKDSVNTCKSFTVENYYDISKITNIYTVSPKNTPFAPVLEAYNYLVNKSSALNKCLIILTDGEFDIPTKDLNFQLRNMAKSSKVSIHYIGSGDAVKIDQSKSDGIYSHYFMPDLESEGLIDKLLRICGDIFNQSNLLTSQTNTTKLSISEDADKVIVFVNGEDSSVTTLKDMDGNGIPFLTDTGKHTYSTIGTSSDSPVNTSLQSHIVIFSACKAGEYILECQNTDFVKIYCQNNSDIKPIGQIAEPSTEEKTEQNQIIPSINIPEQYLLPLRIVLIGLAVAIAIYLLFKLIQKKRKHQIFISYRRSTALDYAGRLRDTLESRGYKVFLDLTSIENGQYEKRIEDGIAECFDVIVILSPGALDNCNNEDDWIRKEVSWALKYNKNLIPVEMEDFVYPDILPPEVEKLKKYQGPPPISKNYFEAGAQKIIDLLETNKRLLSRFITLISR